MGFFSCPINHELRDRKIICLLIFSITEGKSGIQCKFYSVSKQNFRYFNSAKLLSLASTRMEGLMPSILSLDSAAGNEFGHMSHSQCSNFSVLLFHVSLVCDVLGRVCLTPIVCMVTIGNLGEQRLKHSPLLRRTAAEMRCKLALVREAHHPRCFQLNSIHTC